MFNRKLLNELTRRIEALERSSLLLIESNVRSGRDYNEVKLAEVVGVILNHLKITLKEDRGLSRSIKVVPNA